MRQKYTLQMPEQKCSCEEPHLKNTAEYDKRALQGNNLNAFVIQK